MVAPLANSEEDSIAGPAIGTARIWGRACERLGLFVQGYLEEKFEGVNLQQALVPLRESLVEAESLSVSQPLRKPSHACTSSKHVCHG
jgi:hypothetical protein